MPPAEQRPDVFGVVVFAIFYSSVSLAVASAILWVIR